MDPAEALVAEFDMEAANTRKHLAAVPAATFDWKPHDKSMTTKELATHIAEIPGWAQNALQESEFDLAGYKRPQVNAPEELLAMWDENAAIARAAIAATSFEQLGEMWTMKDGDVVYFSMPKGTVLRTFILSHIIHHRAQLGCYLRQHDIPLPATYGPSADDQGMTG